MDKINHMIAEMLSKGFPALLFIGMALFKSQHKDKLAEKDYLGDNIPLDLLDKIKKA